MSGGQKRRYRASNTARKFMTSDKSSMVGDAAGGIAYEIINVKKLATAFTDFSLHETLQTTLSREGLIKPTPIQQMSIPVLLDGKDLVGIAQTGTGKTAAFLLPMLTRLSFTPPIRGGQPPKALILVPTRELSNQISTNLSRLARKMNISHITVFGGARYDSQIRGLRRGIDIVVATPGRLIDLMERGAFNPSGISHLVLDEADHMLDLGFFDPIKKIVRELPKDRQTMLFSATMPPPIEQLGKQFLIDPIKVKAPQTGITADKIAQFVTLMPESEKRDRLCDILNDENTGQCLIFVRTKRRADALAKYMQTRGFSIDALHGDMRQGLRQKVLRNFRDRKLQALIATDVAARGIDIASLSHVVNFDLTDTPLAYVHRIGRTGRAGLGGLALSFCSPSEEPKLAAIISLVGDKIELYDLDGQPVNNFQSGPAPKKRSRPYRIRQQNRGKKFQGGGLPRRSRKVKDTNQKQFQHSSSNVESTRTRDVVDWSPLDGGGDGSPKNRSGNVSRTIDNNKKSEKRNRKGIKKKRNTFDKRNKKGDTNFVIKTVKKVKEDNENQPKRTEGLDRNNRSKSVDQISYDEQKTHKTGKKHLKKGSKPSHSKSFSAKKPASNKSDRKTANRPASVVRRKQSAKPGKKQNYKQGGNSPLRRK